MAGHSAVNKKQEQAMTGHTDLCHTKSLTLHSTLVPGQTSGMLNPDFMACTARKKPTVMGHGAVVPDNQERKKPSYRV